MTFRSRPPLPRIGVATLLVTGGLAVAGGPAYAAERADLAVVPVSTQLARGVAAATAKPFKFTVYNLGPAAARDAVATVDLRGLEPTRVGWVLPAGCTAVAPGFTCPLGDLAERTSGEFAVPLFSAGGRGSGGTLRVSVASATPEQDGRTNTESVPITVTAPGYDLVSWSQDVHAGTVVDGDDADEPTRTPVAPGGTAPLDWAVYNGGSRRAAGISYGIALPAGADFAVLPDGCVRQRLADRALAYCDAPDLTLEPGQWFTHPVRIRVAAGTPGGVLRVGVLFAKAWTSAAGDAGTATANPSARTASAAQRRAFDEVDDADNTSNFDIFVGRAAAPSPSASSPGQGAPGATPPPAEVRAPVAAVHWR